MKFRILALILIVLFCVPALALTADEYYNRAAKKYVMEDLEGAEADLEKALSIDPEHDKAQDLLGVVRNELSRTRPVAPTTTRATTTTVATVAPRPPVTWPRPRPTLPSRFQRAHNLLLEAKKLYERGAYSEAQEIFYEVLKILPGHAEATRYVREIRNKLEKEKTPPKGPPTFLPPVAAPEEVDVSGTMRELLLLGIAFAIVILYILVRLLFSILKRKRAERRRQVCPDCKTKNPEDAEFCQRCGTRLKAWAVITGNKRKWFSKFGWKQNPFTLDVIPALFTGYSSQVEAIMDKLSTRSGHVLVYGEKGVGKTTLLRWLTDNLKKDNHAVYVARPPLNFDDLIRLVAAELKGRNKKYSLYELEGLVKKTRKPVVILLDEAHEVTPEIEQHMRSLGDIEKINHVLAGLPETREKIKKDSPAFFDRVVLETHIDHLSLEETRELMRKRIENAGGKGIKPFTSESIESIYTLSKGRPRMILKVCDWVIAEAIKDNLDVIGAEAGKGFPQHELVEEKPAEKPGPEAGESPKA
jgi:type II secretory pathway predicted ATPase ExeA